MRYREPTSFVAPAPQQAKSVAASREPHIGIWGRCWYRDPVGAARKVTIEVPRDLLRKAQKSTGEGVTATIRRGLELVAATRAYQELRRLRGHVKFSIDWRKLREDRQ